MSYVKRDSRIAIIPIGYADGLDRHFSNGGGEVFDQWTTLSRLLATSAWTLA